MNESMFSYFLNLCKVDLPGSRQKFTYMKAAQFRNVTGRMQNVAKWCVFSRYWLPEREIACFIGPGWLVWRGEVSVKKLKIRLFHDVLPGWRFSFGWFVAAPGGGTPGAARTKLTIYKIRKMLFEAQGRGFVILRYSLSPVQQASLLAL